MGFKTEFKTLIKKGMDNMGKRRKNRKNKGNYNETSLALVAANKENSVTSFVEEVIKGTDKSSDKLTNNISSSSGTTNPTYKTETKTTGTTYSWKSNKVNYDFRGRKNQTNFPEFVNICKPSQYELKMKLGDKLLEAGYTEVIAGDGYIYAKGDIPVLLTAHMDTVHKETVKDFYEYYDENKNQHIISSPQGIGGDDRCGIYMILEIIKTHKCSVLFCEDEESGGIGSAKFCKTEFMVDLESLKYLIELDRMNGNDAVFYDCENDDFTDFIEKNTGYKTAWGSFSDISNLSPDCRVASVNLSCGYYNAHTTSEYVIVEEMLNTIEVVKKLLDVECEQFEYIEASYGYGNWRGYGYSGYSGYGYSRNYWDDDDWYYGTGYGSQSSSKSYKSSSSTYNKSNNSSYKQTSKTTYEDELQSLAIYVVVDDKENNSWDIRTYISKGKSTAEALGRFFIKNPSFCYNDIYDYEYYEDCYFDEGWYDDLV